ncbi:MAG: hypothetical protein ACE5K4_02090 [Candidatus Hydrothermarchaeota archaeon]
MYKKEIIQAISKNDAEKIYQLMILARNKVFEDREKIGDYEDTVLFVRERILEIKSFSEEETYQKIFDLIKEHHSLRKESSLTEVRTKKFFDRLIYHLRDMVERGEDVIDFSLGKPSFVRVEKLRNFLIIKNLIDEVDHKWMVPVIYEFSIEDGFDEVRVKAHKIDQKVDRENNIY